MEGLNIMAQGKKAFIVYTSWKIWLAGMNKEQKGEWLDWVMDYCTDKWKTDEEIEYPKDQVVQMACLMCKETLKRDLKKYEDKISRFRNVGKQYKNDAEIETENGHEIETNFGGDKDKAKDKDKVKDKDIYKESIKEKPTSRFNPPTLEDIKAYCLERNNLVDCERFYDFYASKGWMVGKNKMKDWKACVRTWEKEAGFKNPNEATPQTNNGGFNTLSNEMPSATPYEVANDIKAMHLTPNQVEQWLSTYDEAFQNEVRRILNNANM